MRILDNLLKEIGSALLKELEEGSVKVKIYTYDTDQQISVEVNDLPSGDLQSLIEKWYATYEGKEII